ncbi:hypothetical protein [Methylosinus sp. RM1]|uniref:hypothetical protein n=1 Tax=Methylosinus sp. RM1 TaxID=2583817 RepID=UPI001409E2CC|nr:hypothetical protein [Methylosinus sp. RM1]
MSLTIAQFKAAVAADRELLTRINKGETAEGQTAGLETCVSCGIPLQESITGNRHCAEGFVCSDCYFDDFGEELDRHPIATLRVVRGA